MDREITQRHHHEDLMNLPHRHDLLIRVTVADDGPTGEDGYITVAARLATLIAGLDPHVVDVRSLPADVSYLGKTGTETLEQNR
jgi:hypothetical protein